MKNYKNRNIEDVSTNFDIADDWQREFYHYIRKEYGLNMGFNQVINNEDINRIQGSSLACG